MPHPHTPADLVGAAAAQPLTTSTVVVIIFALAGMTTLAITGDVSGDAVVTIYSLVVGGALGHANGYRSARHEGARNWR